jgi:hypothetical protein
MNGLFTAGQKNPQTARLITRRLRGPKFSRFLERLGINPKQYWLLTDLFNSIGQRREFMGQLGRDRDTLRWITILYGVVMGMTSLGLAATQPTSSLYLLLFVGMTAFLLFSIVISETSNTLVNPVEALMLAHQPINGATYTAAKLTHILTILLYLVPGLNAVPALAGLLLKPFRWSYPIFHMVVALAVGLSIALFCCGLFGWLIRFVPAARLKSAARIAEFLPSLMFFSFAYGQRLVQAAHIPAWLTANRDLQTAAAVVILGFAATGLRSLSMDYLIRVSSMVHAGSSKKMRTRRRASPIGDMVRRCCGGQGARAGFEFLRRLMARDWQFRRQLMALAPSLIWFAVTLVRGWKTSPFSGHFTIMHLLPHFFGFVLLSMCPALVYGSDYSAIWVFLLAPVGALRKFGAGVHAAMWTIFIGVPHTLLFCLLAFAWGVLDSAVFVAFSAAMASLYLALEIRLIDGVPFGKQLQSNRNYSMLGILMLFGAFAAIMAAVQYFLIFRSPQVVVIAAAILAAAAWVAARSSLEVFATAMRHQLGPLSAESTLLYRKIE